MNYQEFIDYIYLRHSGNIKLGLDRILNILKEMKNPNEKLSGIHIAGTNGKGSTAAMCESMANFHNYKTGMNTSPHLLKYMERIRINSINIEFAELLRIYKKWENVFEENEASFFEITTALAFYYFYEQKVDLSIFEVGLGGRLDGTNPFKSDVTVITTIALDHPKSLGNSLEKIAYEKAGIIKENTPVVLGNIVDEKAKNVILKVAEEKNAPTYVFGKDYYVENIRLSERGTVFDYHNPKENLHILDCKTSLLGKHQAVNASGAITAFYLYQKIKGKEFDLEKIQTALSNINWIGRMQILQSNPPVIIDGAHNEEGINILVKNLKEIFPAKKLKIAVAILRDKKLDKMISELGKISEKLYISKNKSKRAAEIDEQVNAAKSVNAVYETFEDVNQATQKALSELENDEVLIITGSLYTISEVLNQKEKLFKK